MPDRPVPAGDARFALLFERWAGRVRGRLAWRYALSGASLGLVVALIAAAIAWRTRQPAGRAAAPAVALLGFAIGAALGRRRRWTDGDVALYLDERLASNEVIATAIDLRVGASPSSPDPFERAVVTNAAQALAADDVGKRARPPLLRPLHVVAPLAAIGLFAIARAPLPPLPRDPSGPGLATVHLGHAEGLEKLAELAKVSARDDAQRERLEKIAKDAERLKEDLSAGLAKRDAQDRIARIEDALTAERLSLGDGEKRAGLESAVGKLSENDATKRAAKELGDHDLEAMDAELEKIANQREKADRELAKTALEDAARAAKAGGAADVAKALEDEKGLMDRRGARAEMLRDLAKAIAGAGESNDELRRESEALDRKGTDAAARKLAESMGKALEKLTPEERQRLAERLRQMAKQGGKSGDPQALKELADELSTAEGEKKLADELKRLASEDTESGEAARQRALDDAQRGAQDTERELGQDGRGESGQAQGESGGARRTQRVPIPVPGGAPQPGAGAGSHHDEGTGDHTGETPSVDAQTLKSRAKGPMNRGSAMPGSVTTFSPGKSGGTANARGTGDLRTVGPAEVDGVEQSDVPQEYREHVRQYFQP